MQIELEPVLYVGRGYAQAGPPEQPFDLVFSVFMLGDGRARVFATHGELDRRAVQSIAKALRALGVRTVLIRRRGVEREINLTNQPSLKS